MPSSYSATSVSEVEVKQEIKAILESGILKKAPNLQHFLEYIAREYFAGNADQIKEYNIAVHALHRPERFDPQSDTIVRVTAHALRKKLEQYYATEGSSHPIQVQIPPGKYILTFERRQPAQQVPQFAGVVEPAKEIPAPSVDSRRPRPWRIWIGSGLTIFVIASGIIYFVVHRQAAAVASTSTATYRVVASDDVLRMRFGQSKNIYIDAAGQEWLAEQYCVGGTPFAHSEHEIQGTDDPALFREGREGKFKCRIPAKSGIYQLELLFADTSGDKEAARQVDFTINDRRSGALDIVDEAGGDNITVGKVYAGIKPMSDGTIHLDFTSDGAFINAIELKSSSSEKGAPLYMLAGPSVVRDNAGNLWGPERFFLGGRRTFRPDNLPNIENARIFEWERYGHFRYLIPVVPGSEYRLRLYFSEGWFGTNNGGPGGIGSREFDVYCNGETLLTNFDILREQKDGTAVETFDHIKPTAHGMLELEFAPRENYPLINAIEIDPEG
jgi:Malectin domain